MRNRTEIYLVVRRSDESDVVISAHATVELADEAAGRSQQQLIDKLGEELAQHFSVEVQPTIYYSM